MAVSATLRNRLKIALGSAQFAKELCDAVDQLQASQKSAVVAGGSAGNFTVTGITTSDRINSVIQLNRDATAANITVADLTSEFTITATNTINNAGGTATTGDALIVLWTDLTP